MLLQHLLPRFSPNAGPIICLEKSEPALVGENNASPLLLPPVDALHRQLLSAAGNVGRTESRPLAHLARAEPGLPNSTSNCLGVQDVSGSDSLTPHQTKQDTTAAQQNRYLIMYSPPIPMYDLPVYASAAAADSSGLDALLGKLRCLDNEELQKLLESEEAVADFTADSAELKQLGEDKQAELSANRLLAEQNFAFGPRIESSRRTLATLSDEADAQRAVFLEKRDRLAALDSAASSDTLISLLEAGCMEADDMAESVAASLADGSIDLAAFVRRYSEARQLYHLRRIKADRLARPMTPD